MCVRDVVRNPSRTSKLGTQTNYTQLELVCFDASLFDWVTISHTSFQHIYWCQSLYIWLLENWRHHCRWFVTWKDSFSKHLRLVLWIPVCLAWQRWVPSDGDENGCVFTAAPRICPSSRFWPLCWSTVSPAPQIWFCRRGSCVRSFVNYVQQMLVFFWHRRSWCLYTLSVFLFDCELGAWGLRPWTVPLGLVSCYFPNLKGRGLTKPWWSAASLGCNLCIVAVVQFYQTALHAWQDDGWHTLTWRFLLLSFNWKHQSHQSNPLEDT